MKEEYKNQLKLTLLLEHLKDDEGFIMSGLPFYLVFQPPSRFIKAPWYPRPKEFCESFIKFEYTIEDLRFYKRMGFIIFFTEDDRIFVRRN